MFDPYRKWLGIPDDCRPPTHYQLLGIAPDEQDLEVIDAAVLRQSAYVRNFQAGKFGEHATRILTEIAAARICLMDAAKRAAYDAELKRKAGPAAPAHRTPVASADAITRTPSGARRPPSAPPAAAPPAAAALRSPAARPLPPPIDLDALASQAGLSGRARGTHVRLPTRQKQSLPAYYWQIPAGVGTLLIIAIIALSATRGSRSQVAEQPVFDPGAVDQSTAGESIEGRDEAAVDQTVGNGPQRPFASKASDPARTSGGSQDLGDAISPRERQMNDRAAAGDLTESEANSGSPSAFPGEADGGESTVAIPLPARDPLLVFSPGTSPFVAIGQNVFDLNTGSLFGKTGAYQALARDALRALSSDGKFYASANASNAPGIEVRSCETGTWLFTLPLDRSLIKLTLLEFGEAGQLVSSARFGNDQRVQIWSLDGGQAIKELLVEPFERGRAALSGDGQTLAIAADDGRILWYDLTQNGGQRQARPKAQIPLLPSEDGPATVDGLQFSSEGDELLAVLDGGARILCWDKDGELTFEQTAGVDLRALWTGASVYEGAAIQWHPGGRGWLLGGHFFFDRELRRVIWMLQTERDPDARMRFLDADRLMTLRGDGINRKLADITIPWTRIDQTLLAVHGNQPSHLGPRNSISLEVGVNRVLGGATKAAVLQEIERMVAARLSAENISVAPQRSTRLKVLYEESPSRSAAKAAHQGDLKLNLSINNGAQGIWSANVVAEAADASGDFGPAKRAELYWRLSTRLHQTPMPYFIPKNAQLLSLPAIIRP